MTKEEIIKTIEDTRELYLREVSFARKRLAKKMDVMTAQQIQSELTFISDMESRAYALSLLLEEIEAY